MNPNDKNRMESLIEYPCAFPIKVFAYHGQQGLLQAVATTIVQLDPTFQMASITTRNSSGAKYVSLTCTVNATSREQLDGIYQSLCDHPMVVMVL